MSEISWIALLSTVSASVAPAEVATDNPDTATPACPVIWKVALFASQGRVTDVVLDQSDLVTRLTELDRDRAQVTRLETYRRVIGVVRGRTGSIVRIVEDPVRCRDLRDTDRDRHLTNTKDRLEHQGTVICRAQGYQLVGRERCGEIDVRPLVQDQVMERGRHVARRLTRLDRVSQT